MRSTERLRVITGVSLALNGRAMVSHHQVRCLTTGANVVGCVAVVTTCRGYLVAQRLSRLTVFGGRPVGYAAVPGSVTTRCDYVNFYHVVQGNRALAA